MLTQLCVPVGYFDQVIRQGLFQNWCAHLQQANILFRTDLSRVEVKIFLEEAFENLN